MISRWNGYTAFSQARAVVHAQGDTHRRTRKKKHEINIKPPKKGKHLKQHKCLLVKSSITDIPLKSECAETLTSKCSGSGELCLHVL